MRKIKSVYFDMLDDEERAMFEFLTRKGMFSKNVKRAVREYMRNEEKPKERNVFEMEETLQDNFEGMKF